MGGLASAAVKLSSNALWDSCRSALVFIVGRRGGDLGVAGCSGFVERSIVLCSEVWEAGDLLFVRSLAVSIQRCASSLISEWSEVAPSRMSMVVCRKESLMYV
jgi:hypothetical protein